MSRHLVDPQLLAALDLFQPLDTDPATLPATRAIFRAMAPPLRSYRRRSVSIEALAVPGPEGAPDVPVLLYRPRRARGLLPVFLHIHGGGYILGSAAASGPECVATAHALGCLVVSVDYRLAPETPAPGAVEDCHAVLAWLHREAASLGIDAARIAVGGESAGGGLAAAVCLLARDRGGHAICFQRLVYPMLDDRTCMRGPANAHVGQFVWTPDYNRFAWSCYLGAAPGGEDISPYAAPARASDLSGLPPAYLDVGALDLFLAEDLDYGARLAAAGVPVELHVYPGAYHAFEASFASDVAVRAQAERLRALRRAFSA
jgi:acetyl esterase/lipase